MELPSLPIYFKDKKPEFDPFLRRFTVYDPKVKQLANIWNTQRDNINCPGSACNVTGVQSAVSLDLDITDDQIFELCYSAEVKKELAKKFNAESMAWLEKQRQKKALNEVHSVLLTAIELLIGKKFVLYTNKINATLIKREIDLGYPVLVAGKFVGDGHFVLIVGYDDVQKAWIVNDSYGNWRTGYRDKNGDHVVYPYANVPIPGFISPVGFLIHADKRIPCNG